jgi:hypothetical protein
MTPPGKYRTDCVVPDDKTDVSCCFVSTDHLYAFHGLAYHDSMIDCHPKASG